MNIDDIKATISQMSDADLMLVLKDIRTSRRVSKKQHKQSGTTKVNKKEGNINLVSLVNTLSKDQINQLIAALQPQEGGK